MRIITLSAFLMAVPALALAANIYEVQNVSVSEPNVDAEKAREKGMDDAQAKALDELQNRLVQGGYIRAKQNIAPSIAVSAVDALDIVNEKIGAGSYSAVYNVIFSPVEVSRIFNIQKIQPTKDPEKFLVVPIVMENGAAKIWKNDWLKSWENGKKADILTPTGDLQDVQNFKEEDLNASKFEGLTKMEQRYGANNIVLVKAEYIKSKNSLTVELTKIKGTDRTVINYEYPGGSEISRDELLEAASNDISYRLENNKLTDTNLSTSPNAQEDDPTPPAAKAKTPEPYAPTAPGAGYMGEKKYGANALPPAAAPATAGNLPAIPQQTAVPASQTAASVNGHTDVLVTAPDLIAWSRIRNKITSTAGVTDLQIKSFTAGRAYVSIGHSVDMESIRANLASQGLTLSSDGQNWQIQETK